MSKRRRHRDRTEITYAGACELLEGVLAHSTRAEILDGLESTADFGRACSALRSAMRSHTFRTAQGSTSLQRIVQSFDGRARRAGLHVLESWDYRTHRFSGEILPVLMLERCALDDIPPERRRAALSALLDHYFVSVLGLVAARAWDDGDPNANLDRVNGLLRVLHGSNGTGSWLIDDAETLLLVAISQYHPDESAYDNLLQDVSALSDAHRLRLALAGAATLGSHLRWGHRFMYRRDFAVMREDNGVDYPWLVFSLVTLMREYRRLRAANAGQAERAPIVEALLNGLTADPYFVLGKTPARLRSHHSEHAELRDCVVESRDALLEDIESHRPNTRSYSPLGFACNFLCNAVVAMVATALAEPGPQPPLNALFTGRSRSGWAPEAVERQARTLMAYARGGAGAEVAALIMYDPYEAAHVFNATVAALREPTLNPARVS